MTYLWSTKFSNKTDLQLQKKGKDLQQTVVNEGNSNQEIVNEAFALVRQASERVLGLRH